MSHSHLNGAMTSSNNTRPVITVGPYIARDGATAGMADNQSNQRSSVYSVPLKATVPLCIRFDALPNAASRAASARVEVYANLAKITPETVSSTWNETDARSHLQLQSNDTSIAEVREFKTAPVDIWSNASPSDYSPPPQNSSTLQHLHYSADGSSDDLPPSSTPRNLPPSTTTSSDNDDYLSANHEGSDSLAAALRSSAANLKSHGSAAGLATNNAHEAGGGGGGGGRVAGETLQTTQLGSAGSSLDSSTGFGREVDARSVSSSDSETSKTQMNVDAWELGDITRYAGWDHIEEHKVQLPSHRSLVLTDKEFILMIQVSGTLDKTVDDRRVRALLIDIAQSCAKCLHKLKGKTLPNLCALHIYTLRLQDGRQAQEHLTELSQTVGETVNITDATCRVKQEAPDGSYLSTYVQNPVLTAQNYVIGAVAVLVSLRRKNKFATVEAFSEQLCQHIAVNKPASLGTYTPPPLGAPRPDLDPTKVTSQQLMQRDQLLVQPYMFDATITVGEAARRSFVNIEEFVLFK